MTKYEILQAFRGGEERYELITKSALDHMLVAVTEEMKLDLWLVVSAMEPLPQWRFRITVHSDGSETAAWERCQWPAQ